MSTLPDILLNVNPGPAGGAADSGFYPASSNNDEPFADVMQQAMSPDAPENEASGDDQRAQVKNETADAADSKTTAITFSSGTKNSGRSPQKTETTSNKTEVKAEIKPAASGDGSLASITPTGFPTLAPVPLALPVSTMDALKAAATTEVAAKNDPSSAEISAQKNQNSKTTDLSAATVTTAKNDLSSTTAGKNLSAILPAAVITEKNAGDILSDGAAKETAGENAADFSPPGFSSAATLSAGISAPAVANPSGTSVAQQDALMKMAEKTGKTAGVDGKNLPGVFSSDGRANILSVSAGQNSALENMSAQSSSSVSADSISVAVENPALEVRPQILDRAQDLISAHALKISDAGLNSLQVVIKPGADTQLSLELRQRGDGVEAQAVLQRGDFSHLSQHWPALQQQLEQRGIKLAPLADGNDFSGNGNFLNGQNQAAEKKSAADDLASASAFAVLPKISVSKTTTYQGWESWA